MTLTINEVASRLKLPVETLHRWIRQGKIPMRRSGETYTIRAELLELWAKEHKLEIKAQSEKTPSSATDATEFDSIFAAMQRGGVFYDLSGGDRETVLQTAVNHIPNLSPSESQRVYEKLIERELLASTGIGHGIALPHPRSHPDIALAMPQITTCFLANAVPFEAIDGKPIRLLMVLLSHSTKQHLTMLSKLSFHLRDPKFRDYILSRPPQTELLSKISALESVCEPTEISR